MGQQNSQEDEGIDSQQQERISSNNQQQRGLPQQPPYTQTLSPQSPSFQMQLQPQIQSNVSMIGPKKQQNSIQNLIEQARRSNVPHQEEQEEAGHQIEALNSVRYHQIPPYGQFQHPNTLNLPVQQLQQQSLLDPQQNRKVHSFQRDASQANICDLSTISEGQSFVIASAGASGPDLGQKKRESTLVSKGMIDANNFQTIKQMQQANNNNKISGFPPKTKNQNQVSHHHKSKKKQHSVLQTSHNPSLSISSQQQARSSVQQSHQFDKQKNTKNTQNMSGRSTLASAIQTKDELSGFQGGKKRNKADMVRHTGKTLKIASHNRSNQESHQTSLAGSNYNPVLQQKRNNTAGKTSKNSSKTNQDKSVVVHNNKQKKETNEAYEHQIRELKRQVEILQMRQKRIGADNLHEQNSVRQNYTLDRGYNKGSSRSNLVASVSQENLNNLLDEDQQFDKAISQNNFGNVSQTMTDFAKSESKPSQNPKLNGFVKPMHSTTPQNMHYPRMTHSSNIMNNVDGSRRDSHLQDHMGCSRSEHLRSPERASQNAYLSRKMDQSHTPFGTKFGVQGKLEFAKRYRIITQNNNNGQTSLSELDGARPGALDDQIDDISEWKKSVHTSMTSRVLNEHDRSKQAMRQSFNSMKNQNFTKFQARKHGNEEAKRGGDLSSGPNVIQINQGAPQITNFNPMNHAISPSSSHQQSFTDNKQQRLEMVQNTKNVEISSYRRNHTTVLDKDSGLQMPLNQSKHDEEAVVLSYRDQRKHDDMQKEEDILFSPENREILTMSPNRGDDSQSASKQGKDVKSQQANDILSQGSLEFGGSQDVRRMTTKERQAWQAAQNLIRLKEIDRKIHAMQQKKQQRKDGQRMSNPSVYSQRNNQTTKLETNLQGTSSVKQSLGREKKRKAKEVLKGLQAEKERQLALNEVESIDQFGFNYFSGGTRSAIDSHSDMPIQQKRQIKFGGGSDHLLEPIIAMTLVMFDPESFRKLLCLSPNWHYLVLQGMDEAFKQLEIGFINQYYEHLFFKRSYTNSSVIYTGGKRGIRVDRVIVCEVLKNNKHINRCLSTSMAYKMHYEKNSIVIGPGKAKAKRDQQLEREAVEHLATYCMDVKKQGDSRLIWIHRDQQEEISQLKLYSGSKMAQTILQRPCVQPIIQVCEGDMVEIAVNFFSLAGMLDLSSVEWLEPQMREPSKETVLTYHKDLHQQNPYRITKIHCDLSRICEVEDSVVEWYDSQYFQKQILSFDHLKSHFKIQNYQCAGVDGLICKLHLVATKPGLLNDSLLGIPILIKGSSSLIQRFQRRLSAISSNYHDDGDQVVVSEIKRMGFLIDRYVDLQLRVGDSLVVYLQRAPC